MPLESKRQQRWMFANHPQMAKRWAEHTPDIKSLPETAGGDHKKEKKGLDMSAVAMNVAEQVALNKLASATKIDASLLGVLAGSVNLSPIVFTKKAFEDPANFVSFLKLATGVELNATEKKAAMLPGGLPGMLMNIAQKMRAAGGKAVQGVKQEAQSFRQGASQLPAAGKAALVGGPAAAAGGVAGFAGRGQLSKPQQPAQTQPQQPQQPAQQQAAPQQPQQGASAPGNPAAAQGQVGGMSGTQKALLVGGGVGAGALGLGALIRNRRRKNRAQQAQPEPKMASVVDRVTDLFFDVLEKRAEELYKKEAADALVKHLDALATQMPAEKTAAVRYVQKAVSEGMSLGQALRRAYPDLSQEKRAELATSLVKNAAERYKQANALMGYGAGAGAGTVPTSTMQEWNGPVGQASAQMTKMAAEKQANLIARLLKNRGLLGVGAATAGGAGLGAMLSGNGPQSPPTMPKLPQGGPESPTNINPFRNVRKALGAPN